MSCLWCQQIKRLPDLLACFWRWFGCPSTLCSYNVMAREAKIHFILLFSGLTLLIIKADGGMFVTLYLTLLIIFYFLLFSFIIISLLSLFYDPILSYYFISMPWKKLHLSSLPVTCPHSTDPSICEHLLFYFTKEELDVVGI